MIAERLRRLLGSLAADAGISLARVPACDSPSVLEAPLPGTLLLPLHVRMRVVTVPGTRVRAGAVLATPAAQAGSPLRAPLPGRVEDRETVAGRGYLRLLPEGDARVEQRVFPPLASPWTAGALVERARAAGLRGQGGAAYPTWRKLAAAATGVRHLLVNAVECEPGLASDRAMLHASGPALQAAASGLAQALGNPALALALHADRPRPPGWRAPLLRVPRRYPAGDERYLLARLTGHRPASRAGVALRPTDLGVLVLNAATVLALAAAAAGLLPARRLVTLHGPALAAPVVVRAWLGTPVAALLGSLGLAAGELSVHEGGAMMGKRIVDARQPVGWGSTGLLLARRARPASRPAAARSPCIRCGLCSDACPAGVLAQSLWATVRSGALERAAAYGLAACTGCACCDLVCPSGLPLAASFSDLRARLREAGEAAARAERARARHARHEARSAARAVARERALQAGRDSLAGGGEAQARAVSPTAVSALLERARRRRGRS